MSESETERKERREKRNRKSKSNHVADWGTATATTLQAAIAAAALTGGALRLGYSRDGGAYAVGVYGDGEPYTDFIGGTEEIDAHLQDYIDLFMAIADESKPHDKDENGRVVMLRA